MWTCPICKTTNETNKCGNCGLDASRDYTNHRALTLLSKSASKISKTKQSEDNVLMASSDKDYVFGRKMDRTRIKTVHFLNSRKKVGEDAWDISEKQNGSIMAWMEKTKDGLLDLYIAANGNIKTNINCKYLFFNYEKMKSILGLEFLETDQTEDMNGMFWNCISLESLDVSHFTTSQVTNMAWMFSDCRSLKSLDVSHFDTSQVKDMSWMFYTCAKLKSLNVSCFDIRQVKDMSMMFSYCKSLENLDVSNFDTSQVYCMSRMFSKCDRLRKLDISNFDTTNVMCMFDLLPEYLGISQEVCLKTKKNG